MIPAARAGLCVHALHSDSLLSFAGRAGCFSITVPWSLGRERQKPLLATDVTRHERGNLGTSSARKSDRANSLSPKFASCLPLVRGWSRRAYDKAETAARLRRSR